MNTIDNGVTPARRRGSQDSIVDGSLLMRVARRRLGTWILLGLAILIVSLVVAMFVLPQNYSATVSISMQKPDSAGSPLLALTGTTSRKYTGVLRSRSFAEKVDRTVHFRQVLRLHDTPKDQDDAIDRVTKDLKVEDSASDGLLYVTVNLPGPPPLLPDPGGKWKSDARTAVAVAANLYRTTLQDFLRNSDTDKELSLLRSADNQVRQAQIAYAASIDELGSFISHSKVRAVPTTSSGTGGGTSDTASAGTQLSSLYLRKAELEARMKSNEATRSGVRNLLANPTANIAALPEEDPLLGAARRQVVDAAVNLETLQISFGSSMQSVRRARERLKLAEDRLHQEVETVLHGKTSEEVKQAALQAEYGTIQKQIDLAEKNFQSNRNMTVEIEKYRNNVMLKLETLKVILTRYAELKLQTVSAQNRMAVIDDARPPRNGKPGILMLSGICLLIPLFVIAVWWLLEYLVKSQAKPAPGAEPAA